MPVIGNSFTATKKLTMPSTEGAKAEDIGWITIKKDIKIQSILDLLQKGDETDKTDTKQLEKYLLEMIKLYSNIIVDWNYEIEEGKKGEITDINIAQALSQRDLFYIESKLQEEAQKAKLTMIEKKS